MEPKKIKILIVDDHLIVRQGMISIISCESDMEVIADVPDGFAAINMYKKYYPDIVIMDLRMEGMSGIEAIKKIRKIDPKSRVIVLTTYSGDEEIYRTVEAGVRAYLLKKDVLQKNLLEVIRDVYKGKCYLPPKIATKLMERTYGNDLTQREYEVLRLLATGKSYQEISDELSVALPTVKMHTNNLFNKLGARDRTQAVLYAIKKGIIYID